jgi:tRNA-(ms[2]io[6]A)-hydroxylase
VLNLASESSQEWVELAVAEIDTILVDHAHCEKKAASTAVGLLFRYPDRPTLLRPLSALAREELEHFELVLDVLQDRGVAFRRLKPAPYASALYAAVRPEEPERLLDTLLVCALIEARSCERMKQLAEHLPEPRLVRLYRGLLASEARHHATYVDLARELFDDRAVADRLAALAAHEAEVLRAPLGDPRVHA